MAFLKDFKEFAMKGNVVDLAVWVIIGTAFGKIVSSLVGDVVMPALGALLWGVDFTKLAYSIPSVSGTPVVIAYGKLLQTSFDFVIVALAIFIFISLLNKAVKKPAAGPAAIPADIALLTEIRDALGGKKSAPVAKAPAPKAKAKSKSKK
jgi:large conductance mechanosensitive channel